MKKTSALLKEITLSLKNHGVPDAAKEAETILSSLAGIDRVSLYRDDPEIPDDIVDKIRLAVKRRSNREPLQYILGSVEFFGLKFGVGPGVLIPRPETEILVQASIEELNGVPSPLVLDLFTGSGCIAIAVAKNLPAASVTGTDISPSALSYAKENAALNKVNNLAFLEGPLFGPVDGMVFDAILSNPPYVRTSEIEGLEPEVKDYEPMAALDGGPDGFHFYRLILADIGRSLRTGGLGLFEIGMGQTDGIVRIARASGLETIRVVKDLSGIDRVMVLRGA